MANKIEKAKHVLYRILPSLFWILIMLSFDTVSITVLTIIGALIHECGHTAAIYLLNKGKGALPKATLSGFKINTGRLYSYNEEIFIAAAGPLINIVCAVLFLPFFFCEYIKAFAFINLLSAVSNLVPIREYDGYKIICSVIAKKKDAVYAEKIMGHVSALFCSVCVLLSLILIAKIGEGYWIFAIFFTILIKDIYKSHSRLKNEKK